MSDLKYLKLFEGIDWEFDEDEDEEFDNLDYPVSLKELSTKEFDDLLDKLKIEERYLFHFNKSAFQDPNYYVSYGKIIGIEKDNNIITIEFDKHINGHDGIFAEKKRKRWALLEF